jgi:hypothetical protein
VGHRRIGRRILGQSHTKDTQEPSIKDSISIASEAAHQMAAAVMPEALTQLDPCIACFIVVKPTTATKIAPSSWNRREKWSKTPHNLRSNQHLDKSTTPCNGLLTTNNTVHHILHFFHRKLIKTAKPNLWHTNHTITPQPTIDNLRQFHK